MAPAQPFLLGEQAGDLCVGWYLCAFSAAVPVLALQEQSVWNICSLLAVGR